MVESSGSYILVGAFHETLELCHAAQLNLIGVIDNELVDSFCGLPILGTDSDAAEIAAKHPGASLILTPDFPVVREKLEALYSALSFKLPQVSHPNASVSNTAQIGAGTTISNFCAVTSNVTLGKCCRLNLRASVMHDSTIGDFTTIAPSATILGRVSIGKRCYIGANATILPTVTIGDDCTIGAGAVVTKDVGPGNTIKGVPAK